MLVSKKSRKGWILKIGSRRSPNYFRIYQRNHSLRFEHEIKEKFLQDYHILLVSSLLDEFENKLASHFSVYFGKLLPMKFSYLDWLVVKLRPIRKQVHFLVALNSDYINSEIIMEARSLIIFLQFFNYAQYLDFERESLGNIMYRKVFFQLQDFFKIQNSEVKSITHYQLGKIKDFFEKLQTGLFVTSFSDQYFQSLVVLPQVPFEKDSKLKCWIGKVWVVEKLFFYQYTLQMPYLF